MNVIERINKVVNLLCENEESLVEYLKETEFDYSFFDNTINPDIPYEKIVYYDFLIPGIKIENETIKELVSFDFVTAMSYSIFLPGTKILPHKDPHPGEAIYHEVQLHKFYEGNTDFRRLHFPIEDSPENCGMIFDGKPFSWKKGEVQFFDVHTYTHEFYNDSDNIFSLLLIDVLTGE